jgi:hypothetical protein
MIIKLKGATFSNNINGLLNSWPITFYGRTLVTGTFTSSVSKGETYTATFSIAENCTVDSVTITRGGSTMSGATISGNTISISVPTTAESGPINITFNGSKENGDDPIVPDEPDNPGSGGDEGVTIDVSARTTSNSHAQSLPSGTTSTTNLWNALTPEAMYYDANKKYVSYQKVSSIVFPVLAGDKLTATSFGTTNNGSGATATGIRISYLLDDSVVKSMAASEVSSEYKSNGYVTVPSGVNAVCIPVWDRTETGHEVYLFPTGATGTPTKPSNFDNSGSSSGGTGSGSGNVEVEDTSGATWYINHLNNGAKLTSAVNIAGRGWCHKPGTAGYNAYVGKPVNTIGFFTNLASQNITIGKVAEKGGVDAMTEIATVTATNPSGTTKGFCYVTFPEVTLNEGECLVFFAQDDANINFYYAASAGVTDANGVVDGNFYGRVPKVYGSGTAWTAYTDKICLGISVGYIAS